MAAQRAQRVEDETGNIAAEQFFTFLNCFREKPDETPSTSPDPKYYDNVRHMRDQEQNTLYVDFTDVQAYDAELADSIKNDYYRLEPYLKRAVHRLVRNVEPSYADSGKFKEFWISFFNMDTIRRLRDLKTENIGHLVCFSGTVTRTSEVRPELYLGSFRCNQCATVMHGIEQHFKYTTPLVCKNATCGNKQFFTLIPEECVFCDWQKVKVQENASEIPGGSLPRTMDVILRNTAVEQARAGDRMVFTGCLIVAPDVGALAAPGEKVVMRSAAASGDGQGVGGLKSLGMREMTHKLMFLATSVAATSVKEGMINIRGEEELSPQQVLAMLGEEAAPDVVAMSQDPYVYRKLARSIAPSVFGHESIKQALLLMLFGGVHKQTKEGINLRGDINVAIIGDPSCAKSQMLKYVANFLPRAVYTSGKSSTAAGLTATVVKDSETGEFAIEAGALMLADNGICCIDEFDKMDVKDQVAIHEAMEQQTISIAKAGIQATLNARASILAAANPMGGRYDKSRPLRSNINLPPAILSRFDLLHVMVDETTEAQDVRIAEHILNVHRMQQAAFLDVPYTTEQMQRYIKYARAIKPELTPQAQRALVAAYKELRGEDAAPGTATAYRITVRQLEALVRLSEAMARVFCSDTVRPSDVEEAKKLLKASILKIEQSDVELEELMGQPVFNDDLFGNVPEREQQQQQQQQQQEADPMETDEPPPQQQPAADGQQQQQGEQQQGEQQQQQQQPPKQPIKVTAKKYELVKTMLLKKLRDQQEHAAAQQQQEEPQLQLLEVPDLPEDADEEQQAAHAAAVAENEQRRAAHEAEVQRQRIAAAGGLSQQELLRWYLETLVQRGVLTSHEEAAQEYELVVKIVARLIRKDAAVAVVHTPAQLEGEAGEEYRARANADRLLALAPNYYPDE